MRSSPRLIFTLSATLPLSAAALDALSPDRTRLSSQTALDRYITAPDTNYTWHLVNTLPGDGYTTYVVEMISQSWLTTNEVNRTLWQHWLTIVKPHKLASTTGLLFIGG